MKGLRSRSFMASNIATRQFGTLGLDAWNINVFVRTTKIGYASTYAAKRRASSHGTASRNGNIGALPAICSGNLSG